MSRIFALAGVTTVLTAGAVGVGVAYEGLSSPSSDAEAVGNIMASGLDVSQFVPFVLMIGIAIMAIGVFNR